MATTITVETDKQLPPKGSSRRNRLEVDLQAAVQGALNDSRVQVNLVKR